MSEPVTSIVMPSRLEYHMTAGQALTRYLRGIERGVFLGSRCPKCGQVYVPLRTACPSDGTPITGEVEVADTGTVTTYAVNNIPDPRAPAVPYVCAYILLDGADIDLLALVGDVAVTDVEMGMRVRAVWRPREEWGPTMNNIKWFAPVTVGGADNSTEAGAADA